MSIDPKEVNDIRQMDIPQHKKELESYQGMVNYLKYYFR